MLVEENEIHEQIDKAGDWGDGSSVPGMTYEQGVRAALEWVLSGDEPPIEEEAPDEDEE